MVAGKKQNKTGGQVLDEIVKHISDKSYPPVHLWNPEFCGDINMRIAVNGSWHYMDSPITRHEMVRLFSTVLRKDGDDYFLVTPVEKLAIKVDDVPFFVVSMSVLNDGQSQVLSFDTLTDDKVIADVDHAIMVKIDAQTGEPSPYIHIRGGMYGRLSRAVYYELVNIAEPMRGDKNTYGIWSSGKFFPIGRLIDEEAVS